MTAAPSDAEREADERTIAFADQFYAGQPSASSVPLRTYEASRRLLDAARRERDEWHSEAERVDKDYDDACASWAEDKAEMRAETRRLAARVEVLEKALRGAANVFREYEKIHEEKGTEDGNAKAATNAKIAQRCEDALSPAPEPIIKVVADVSVAPGEAEMQDQKGKVLARVTNIAPEPKT